MKRKIFYLTKSQIEVLNAMSESSGLSVAELVRRAIDAFVVKSCAKKVSN